MTPAPDLRVNDTHRRELHESAISEDVARERGYQTIGRPSKNDQGPRQYMDRLGIPRWATREDRLFPGLLVPMYGPRGNPVSCQYKPRVPVTGSNGKPQKYTSPRGRASVLDVHPRNKDRIIDPTVGLWITEGVKKADSLLSNLGACVVALAGVFNWRSTHGTLGDWEDVVLKGRKITICFDSDAHDKPDVVRAMQRLGRWLRSKGASEVWYIIVPKEVTKEDGTTIPIKGVDDFFYAGGTKEQLALAAKKTAPKVEMTKDTFTDARLAETVADDLLVGRYVWVRGRGWMRWTGKTWTECSEEAVIEQGRRYSVAQYGRAAKGYEADNKDAEMAVKGWHTVLSSGKLRSVMGLARGIVEKSFLSFDADPDLFNCQNGIIDLTSGDLLPHDPEQMMTKISQANYEKGATHPDWATALTALPSDEVRQWYQARLGQAITGYMPPDDVLVVQHGGGENGKGTIDAVLRPAIGSYRVMVSDRALMGNATDNHPTEMMDFQGARYALLEETPEQRRLDVTRLKKVVGTEDITARRIRQDPVTFKATHSLFVSTNYKPIVEDSDRGSWRRLLLLSFPYTFKKAYERLEGAFDRYGDPKLRARAGTDHDVWTAALAWLVEGAVEWYRMDRVLPMPPATVLADTAVWRGESDLVYRFWHEVLTPDPAAHVNATVLYQVFNDWLTAHGHREWSDRMFNARFSEHELVKEARLVRKKIRANDRLSLPPLRSVIALPTYAAWMGVRYSEQDK